MHLERITNPLHSMYNRALELYQISFPLHEQREAFSQAEILRDDDYHFVDTLAIIQDVAFKLEENPAPKLHWWNRFGIWLSKLRRK